MIFTLNVNAFTNHKTTALRSNELAIAASSVNALSTTMRVIERALPLGKGTVTSVVL